MDKNLLNGSVLGKGESTIDRFVHTRPEHIIDRSNGDIACNTYKLYKEDTKLLTDLGVCILLLLAVKKLNHALFLFVYIGFGCFVMTL